MDMPGNNAPISSCKFCAHPAPSKKKQGELLQISASDPRSLKGKASPPVQCVGELVEALAQTNKQVDAGSGHLKR